MKHATFIKYAATHTPRYTSYPTALQFHAGVDATVFGTWLQALDPVDTGSLYLHIPYCREMCWYCGCSTRATTRKAPVEAYLERLIREIEQTAARISHRCRIGHVHFGGGTPTILDAGQFTRLMVKLHRNFDVAPDAEIAIEIDPRTLTPQLAGKMAACGVNRVSVGVQTFDPDIQSRINRVQSFGTVEKCIRLLRKSGISKLGFDLLYGLPGQSTQSCIDTLTQAVSLAPGRVSVFGYAHVPHMRKHQKLINECELPDANARVDQSLAIANALKQNGYVPIGIDHYARADDALADLARQRKVRRNFQGYTTDQSGFLIGLGSSAISRLPQGYVQNTADVAVWSTAVDAGRSAACRGFALSVEDKMRSDIIEQLMSGLGADLDATASRYGLPPPRPDLADLEKDGLVESRSSSIIIPETGRMLARIVASRYDSYWQGGNANQHSRSV